MRAKIIAVFTVVVLVVGVLAFALTRASLNPGSPRTDAARALVAAEAVLRVQAGEVERWLASQAADPKVREPFSAGTGQARSDGATSVANGIKSATGKTPAMAGLAPSLVAIVDAKGTALGRDGSPFLRGDDLGGIYPALRAGLAEGRAGSDVWVTPSRNEQMLVSWAPIRGENGQVLGGLLMGIALSDGLIGGVGAQTSGAPLWLQVKTQEGLRVVTRSKMDLGSIVDDKQLETGVSEALASGQAVDVATLVPDFAVKVSPLGGYGDGRRAVLVAATRANTPATTILLFPFLGAMAVGIVLVAIAGHFLGQSITRPVEEIEEGLLAIMNGRTDLRFQIVHPELGGLVSRLNSLLSQLLGVQEDEETGAPPPAHAARGKDFPEALAVDESLAQNRASGGEATALGAEAEAAYHQRIFDDYIRAKKSVGDPVDHITRDAFVARIVASEKQMAQKHGKPVRYKVEVRGKEVVLLAVPIG
ncbi:MXAN_5187 C-terminal domain-containing protein [Polyangium sp. 6x1]|uniref:MXAN_5187 C-terminal domain-containing protein n=1 Tax=Polyangium sp. 6x1 TaxID=3042689 RepID=UPI002482C554|nr:MXAN_5187 C-terminal domain-containing protein [Polyangium sp. 6x1]MDI1450357.1 MXAN_5187 C-terminal domain-containing protein [Polyangium sp. 6x1]